MAKIIRDLQLAAFCPYFLRCETDVLQSFDKVKDVLELKELKWQTCNIPCGSPEKLVIFLWSLLFCLKLFVAKNDYQAKQVAQLFNLQHVIFHCLKMSFILWFYILPIQNEGIKRKLLMFIDIIIWMICRFMTDY